MRLPTIAVGIILVLILSPLAYSQPSTAYGDVLVSIVAPSGFSKILIYTRDGTLKGELASIGWSTFGEMLFRNGSVYAATIDGIYRIDPTGQLTKFSDIRAPAWMAPALDGSIVAANTSGELYHVAPDGSQLLYRDTAILMDPSAKGIELKPDQCTVYYLGGGSLVVWDVCENTTPSIVGPISPIRTRTALRLLPDGTFLAAYRSGIARLDADGNDVRHYAIPSHGLALDIDRESFWAGVGSTLLRIDIETGAILTSVEVAGGGGILFIGVVGEPRVSLHGAAEIPAFSSLATFILLAAALAALALTRL
jgi:hypothetical protein